ncbi:hypothetical protein OG508_25810 [Streptomyces sp. NBC_01108]|uniref:hypothetical protein n=1 Tax=Streptomyces sp. NBC_01108 TaxID=2903751 RepID=UPI0038739E94|nr:hypothetical protein OG508_25810 [Streptomyces sp. NBC_01108]
MKQPSSEELVEIAEELDDLEGDCTWAKSYNLWCLVCAAQHCGFLPGVSVHQLVPLGRRDDFFLITVEVTPTIVRTLRVVPMSSQTDRRIASNCQNLWVESLVLWLSVVVTARAIGLGNQ